MADREAEQACAGAPRWTPGPWVVTPYGDGDSLVIHSGDEWRVCFMATPGDSPGAMARIEANARLIAAAPELAEVVETLLSYVRDVINGHLVDADGEDLTDLARADLKSARAALAKAGASQ